MLRNIFRNLITIIGFQLIGLILASVSFAAIIINSPMTDTNAAGWTMGGSPTSALLTGNGTIDPVGSGWLRLTNNSVNQTGFAYNSTAFDLSQGALIQFDYATWGGTGADGYSVFLFDANVPTFNIGAFGGSLGYAQKTPTPGISGGYIGVGIDEYGNFANPGDGPKSGGPGQRPNTVTIRGTVTGFGNGAIGQTLNAGSYPWIATSATTPSSLWYNGSPRPSQTGPEYRKVIIQISPAPNPVANVWIQFGYNTTPVQLITNQALPALTTSQQLKVGFGASTGGSTNYHEIHNLLITTLGQSTSIDLGVTKTAVTTGTSTQISTVLVGVPFQYQIVAANFGPNNITATGVGIVDTFPASITPGAWACTAAGGATCGTASGSGNLNTTANLPRNGSVTYTVNATVNSMPVGNLLSNTASLTIPGAISDYYPNNNSVTSTINAYGPPTATKTFAPATVLASAPSVMTITLTNPNNIVATGVAFTDNYPANLVNTGTPAGTTTCTGGTVTAAANGTSLALSGGTIPANGSCTVKVNVTSATTGTYNNSTGAVTTTNIGSGTAAAGTLAVMAKPAAAKTFSPNQIGVSGLTALTVTLTNPNSVAITGAAFTDNYPANLFNTGTPNVATTCTGGTVTAAANGTSLALSNGTVPANGSCTVTVNVTSAVAGTYNNSTGSVTTTNAGTGNAATGALTVLLAPMVAKSFAAPGTILPGGTSVMTVTLTNPNSTAITGATFTDNYPTNLVNTATPAGATTCASGTVTAAANGTSLALAGGTIPANGSCTITVNVTSATATTYINSTGTVSTTNAGSSTATTGTLVVMSPATATKGFNPTPISVGGTTLLTVTLTNPNSVSVSGAAFTDNYPANMKNTGSPGGVTTCTGGTVTAAANGTSLALSGGTIPANSSCTVTASVTITAAGTYNNSTGSITTTNAGAGTAATANLNGPQPPTVTKSFTPASIVPNAASTMTITLSNSNNFDISAAAFTDSYPAGLVNTATANGATTCTGGTVTAAASGTSLTLSGGTIPANGSCTVTVNTTSATASIYTNSTGAVTTGNTGNGTAANGTLVVMAAPSTTKSFTPASVLVNTPSILTITLTNPNPNTTAITGVAFTDSYPAGLVNTATANGTTTCTGGTVTAANNGTSLALSGATIPASGSCTVTVNVTSATANAYNNSTGPVTTTNAGSGTAASAILTTTILSAPTVVKSFAPASTPLNTTSLLTITLTNPNATIITGAVFTDSYPAGLVNTAAANGATTCAGGTVTAANNGTSLSLSGASIPAFGSCTVTVNVKSAAAGTYNNSTGTVTSSNASTGTAATATLEVLTQPTVAKSFTPTSITKNDPSQLTITLTNANTTAITGAAFTDNYPANLVNTAAPNGTTTCTSGTVTATSNGTSLALAGGTIPANSSCTVTVNVTSATAGSYPNSTGPVTTANAGTGTAANATLTTTILSAPTVTKSFSPTQVTTNEASLLTITLTNPNSSNINSAAFTDTYPANLVNSGTPNGTTNCSGGVVTAAANGTSVTLSGATIPANGSCTVSVNVSSGSTGTYNNTTGTVTSSNATTSATSNTAPLTVATLGAPIVVKTFTPNQVVINGTSVLTVTLTNPNGSNIRGAAFTDNYPPGLVNTGTPNGVTSCTGGSVSVTAPANGTSLALSGATIPANSSCTVTVNVKSASAGSYLNSTGPVTTTNGAGTGVAGSATLDVLQAPTASKNFNPSAVPPNAASVMTITLTNSNSIPITGAAFTDNYPAGLVNTSSANGTSSCGGTVTAANNGNSVALTGATIPGNDSCTVSVNVTSATAGSYLNSTGVISTTNAGTGSAATGTLSVITPATITVNKSLLPASDSGKFNLLVGATTVATNIGDTGTGNTTVPANVAVTVSETAGTATSLANYATTFSCTNGSTGNGSSVTFTPTPGQSVSCTFTNNKLATVTIVKQSNGGTGSFSYTGGTNGLPANLTLDTSTGNPKISSVYTVTTLGVATAITETIPAGWTLNASSTSCTDGTTTFGTLVGGTLTIPAVNVTAGKNITCTFVNDKKIQILLVKRSIGGGGPFTFNVTGSLTDTVSLNPPSNNATDSKLYTDLTPGAAITFTEGDPGNNWFLADITCVDVLGSAVGSTVTQDINNRNATVTPVIGASMACTFTNVKNADLALTKNTLGGNGTFGFTVSGLKPVPTSANITTVAGTGTAAFKLKTDKSTETIYTIDESSLPAGWSLDGISCTGTTGPTSPVVTGSSVSFGVMPGDVTLCTYTNSKLPTLTKAFASGTIAVGQTSILTFTITNPGSARTALAFTDTLPGSGALTATATASQCGGTVAITGGNVISFNGGSVAAGGNCPITITVTGITSGSYINGPSNSSISGVSASLINGVTDQTLNVVNDATITVFKSADKAIAKPGDIITYTLLFTNTGGVAASNISVSDVLSPYVAFGTNSYGTAPVPPGPAFDFFGSGTIPTPNSPQYFNSSNGSIIPSGAYDGTVAKWTIPFTGTLSGGSNFTIKYKTQVK